ncbi:hypothetical protein D3C87_1628290 [compost metagenome]
MHRKHVGHVVISRGEVEDPRATFGGGHRAHRHVPAPVPLARGDHVPVRGDEFDLDPQTLGDLLGDVDIEPVDFILVVDKTLGWPGRRRGDGHGLAALNLVQDGASVGGADERQRECGG